MLLLARLYTGPVLFYSLTSVVCRRSLLFVVVCNAAGGWECRPPGAVRRPTLHGGPGWHTHFSTGMLVDVQQQYLVIWLLWLNYAVALQPRIKRDLAGVIPAGVYFWYLTRTRQGQPQTSPKFTTAFGRFHAFEFTPLRSVHTYAALCCAARCCAFLCVAFRSTAACFSVMNIHTVEKMADDDEDDVLLLTATYCVLRLRQIRRKKTSIFGYIQLQLIVSNRKIMVILF